MDYEQKYTTNAFVLAYDCFDPSQEGLRETLTSSRNGYFCIRGAAEWEDAGDVHYLGTYTQFLDVDVGLQKPVEQHQGLADLDVLATGIAGGIDQLRAVVPESKRGRKRANNTTRRPAQTKARRNERRQRDHRPVTRRRSAGRPRPVRLDDRNIHTDTRMHICDQITELLRTHGPCQAALAPAPEPHYDQLSGLLESVLTDPNIHTDTRARLHREIREIPFRPAMTPASRSRVGRR